MKEASADLIKELMEQYEQCREEWIKTKGPQYSEKEYHEWFTEQVLGEDYSYLMGWI